MEQKKLPQADIERRRTTGFLLGLIAVLALLYVALEWQSADEGDDIELMDLTELMHESELVPMQNLPVQQELQERTQVEKAEQLHVVDDDTELSRPDEALEGEGSDDETLLAELQEQQEEAPLASMETDPKNPLNFHVVEELPQFPGGAVEWMKWLTKNLRYPQRARARKQQGRVVATFYVEADGSITGIAVTEHLTPECDREVLRVLRMMPPWTPGTDHDKPCRTKVQIPVVFKL